MTIGHTGPHAVFCQMWRRHYNSTMVHSIFSAFILLIWFNGHVHQLHKNINLSKQKHFSLEKATFWYWMHDIVFLLHMWQWHYAPLSFLFFYISSNNSSCWLYTFSLFCPLYFYLWKEYSSCRSSHCLWKNLCSYHIGSQDSLKNHKESACISNFSSFPPFPRCHNIIDSFHLVCLTLKYLFLKNNKNMET